MTYVRRFRPVMALFAIVTALILVASDADARVGRGTSLGTRGTRSFNTTPPTATAPNGGTSLNRTMAQPGPTAAPSRGLFGGYFNRPGLFGGLLGGFLGAGLLGLLFGHGLFGGMGGIASIFGLLLQIILVVFVARMIWGWWQRRQTPAYAGGPAFHGLSPGYENSGGNAGPSPAPGGPVTLGPADYDTFERLLGEIQTAYGAEDLNALRQRATPEVVSYFADDLAQNASNGVVNRVADVKLLQGDLAEAWREGETEYATVAMRYSLKDTYVERSSGRVVEGDAEHPDEVTELWTFRRNQGGAWLLSAIQQTQ